MRHAAITVHSALLQAPPFAARAATRIGSRGRIRQCGRQPDEAKTFEVYGHGSLTSPDVVLGAGFPCHDQRRGHGRRTAKARAAPPVCHGTIAMGSQGGAIEADAVWTP